MMGKILMLAKFLGFIPLSSSNSKSNIIWPTILLIISLIRSTLHVILFFEFGRYKAIAHPVAYAMIEAIQFIVQSVFLLVVISGCIRYREKFDIFLKMLLPSQKHETADPNCLKVTVLCHVLYCAELLIEVNKYITDGLPLNSLLFHWADYQIAQYAQFFMAFFIHSLVHIISKQYVSIKENIEMSMKPLVVSRCIPKMYVRQKLTPIKKSLAELHVIVLEFNSLFSWPMLLILIGIPLNTMTGFEFLLLYKFPISCLTISFICQVSLSVIVIYLLMSSCDDVERFGKEITKTCYLVQENALDLSMAKELIHFGQYAQHLRPAITAAGFVKINKSLFSAMISTLVTYVIICIQFGSL